MEEIVRGRIKPTHRVRLRAWLLLRAAIRNRTKASDESVVVLRAFVALQHPNVAHCAGLEPGSPELAAAERFLERQGYVRPVKVGAEPRTFLVTDAGRTWLEQDRWDRPWWRKVFT